MTPTRVPLWCRVFPDEKEALQAIAEAQKRPLSVLCREILLEGIKTHKIEALIEGNQPTVGPPT